MRLTEHRRWSVLQFANYTEAIDFASKHAAKVPEAIARDIHHVQSTQTRSFPHAAELARKGWPEGRAKVRTMRAAVNATSKVIKPEIFWNVCGDAGIDMGKFMTGHPECFMDWRQTEEVTKGANGSVVHIVFNGSCAMSAPTDAIENRGAAVVELIDALEAAGRRVELTWIKANTVNDSTEACFMIEIPLKSADFALQEDQMIFALTHPSMNRRIGFALTGQCGVRGRQAALGSLGAALPLGWTYDGADIFIPRLDSINYGTFRTADDTRRWVLKQLQAQGVTVEGAR